MKNERKGRADERAGTSGSVLVAAGAALLLGACQTTPTSTPTASMTSATVTASDARLDTRSGFLTDYARLAPVPGGDGIKCWRQPNVNWRSYDKVLITRMQVTLKPGQVKSIDPSDLKALLDYFHNTLVTNLKPQFQVADKAGPAAHRPARTTRLYRNMVTIPASPPWTRLLPRTVKETSPQGAT